MNAPCHLEPPEVVGLAVVHRDPAADGARTVGSEEQLELVSARAAAETARHEDGVALAGDAVALELVEDGRERIAAVIVGDGREGVPRRLHDHRRPTATRGHGRE